jgi:hypothetical protein
MHQGRTFAGASTTPLTWSNPCFRFECTLVEEAPGIPSARWTAALLRSLSQAFHPKAGCCCLHRVAQCLWHTFLRRRCPTPALDESSECSFAAAFAAKCAHLVKQQRGDLTSLMPTPHQVGCEPVESAWTSTAGAMQIRRRIHADEFAHRRAIEVQLLSDSRDGETSASELLDLGVAPLVSDLDPARADGYGCSGGLAADARCSVGRCLCNCANTRTATRSRASTRLWTMCHRSATCKAPGASRAAALA